MTAQQIANLYTEAQIREKITLFQAAYDKAVSLHSYSLDTTQGNQSVTNQKIEGIERALGLWMSALDIKTTSTSGDVQGSIRVISLVPLRGASLFSGLTG